MAAAAREAVAKENRAELELERTPWGKTGYVNVVEVKGKYQARLCKFLEAGVVAA